MAGHNARRFSRGIESLNNNDQASGVPEAKQDEGGAVMPFHVRFSRMRTVIRSRCLLARTEEMKEEEICRQLLPDRFRPSVAWERFLGSNLNGTGSRTWTSSSCCCSPKRDSWSRLRSFFVVYYFALPILVGYAPELMNKTVLGPVNLAYLFALSQFFMAWGIAWLYVRAARKFDDFGKRIMVRLEHEEGEVRNEHHAVFFLIFIALTLAITYWASKQSAGSAAYFAAGRRIMGWQNGFAIAGDFMSAASFLLASWA